MGSLHVDTNYKDQAEIFNTALLGSTEQGHTSKQIQILCVVLGKCRPLTARSSFAVVILLLEGASDVLIRGDPFMPVSLCVSALG